MAQWGLKLQDGAALSEEYQVQYDDVRQLLTQFSAPTANNDLTNKLYADSYIVGKLADVPIANGDIQVWDNDDDFWITNNVNDAIFNAAKILNKPVSYLSGGPFENEALIYNGVDSFENKAIVNSCNRSTANFSPIVNGGVGTPQTGNVYFVDVTSSDNSVNIQTQVVTDDLSKYLDFRIPLIDLENTADGTSFYPLSNPGAAVLDGDPYLFKGLNTITPTYINFTQDSDNIYVNFDATSLAAYAARLFTSQTITNIGASQAETDLASFTIAANTLNANGKKVVYTCRGNFTAITTALTLKFKFAGSTIFTIPNVGLLGNAGSSWHAVFTVKRSSSTSIAADVVFEANDDTSLTTNSFSWNKAIIGSTYDFTTTNIIKGTCQTGLSTSLVQNGAELELF